MASRTLRPPAVLLLPLLALATACGGGGGSEPVLPATSAPSVASLSPAAGPTAGGTEVTIHGAGFAAGARVTIGASEATVTSATGGTAMVALAPPHAAGPADVTVTNPDGQAATLAGGYTYQGPAVVLVALNVRGGPVAGGTRVLAVGSGFAAGVAVTVGGLPASDVTLVPQGAAGTPAVSFYTPPHAEGRVDVTVTNPDGQAATMVRGFHYGPPPLVSGLTCSGGCTSVRQGDAITIDGANFATGPDEGVQIAFFSPDTGQNAFVPLDPATPGTPTRLVVIAPRLDGGRTYRVAVTNYDGQAATPASVSYQ
jgi:hypothetical protein